MSITYTYKIVSVNETARCMEVVYTSEGNPTMHIGTRLPYQGESLEAVIEMYAPLRYWEELKTPLVVPEVGVTGMVISPPPQEQRDQTAPTAGPLLGSIPTSVL